MRFCQEIFNKISSQEIVSRLAGNFCHLAYILECHLVYLLFTKAFRMSRFVAIYKV